MSKSIDERIVEMKFNNKQFEDAVQTSIKTLKDLDKSLDLKGASKGLSDLDKAGRNFSLAGIAEGVQTISDKFSAMGIIGITILQNITNAALDCASNMVRAFTITPMLDGLGEYETKINAIGTILTNTASKGTTIDDVTKALDELNKYADLTIYNFADMTKNIGAFTTKGVDLDTSVNSIKGIANLGAAVGASASDVSRGMYQLSQAVGTGLKLIDWKSVENANLSGEIFEQRLISTAKEMGTWTTKEQKMIDSGILFRNTLETGWASAEVLTATLKEMGMDDALTKKASEVKTLTQLLSTMAESLGSGWATTWERVFGNKDQATALFTGLNDAFSSVSGASADARNSLLEFWNVNGGRQAIFEAIGNALFALGKILEPIQTAFSELFPPMTGERLVELSKSIRDITRNFKIGDETAVNLKATFKGLFSALDLVGKVIGTALSAFKSLIGVFLPTGDGILGVTSAIGTYLTNVNQTIEASGVLNKILEKFKEIIKPIPNLFGGVATIGGVFLDLASKVAKAVGSMNLLDNVDFNKIFGILQGGVFTAILLGINKFIRSFTDMFSEVNGVLKGVKGILDGVRGSLEAYQNNLKADTLMKIAIALGILTAALFVLSGLNGAELAVAMAGITGLFIELMAAMAVFTKIAGGIGIKSALGLTGLSVAMIALSAAILILSFAMTRLSDLSWGEIGKGIVSVGALSAVLVATAKLLSSGTGGMIKGAAGYILFAAALVILVSAVERLGVIPIATLATGLVSLGVLMAGLGVFVNLVKGEKMISTAVGLTILSAAMLIFSSVIEKLGMTPIGVLITGLVALAVALTILATAMSFMSGALLGASALLVISAALAILVPIIGLLGNMPLPVIVQGLLTLAAAFVVIGGMAFVLTPLIPAILGLGVALTLLGVGIALVGGGVLAISAGLAALAISGSAGVAALVVVIASVIGLIPMFVQQVGLALESLLLVIINTVNTLAGPLIDAAINLLDKLLDALIEHGPSIAKKMLVLGDMILIGLANAILDGLGALGQLGIEMGKAIMDAIKSLLGIKSPSTEFENIGTMIISGLINGVKNKISSVVASAKNMGTAFLDATRKVFDMHSPSEVLRQMGLFLTKGLSTGIDDGTGDIVESGRTMSKKFIDATSKKTAEGAAAVVKTTTKAAKDAFDAAVEWMDERKYYNKLSLQEELDTYLDLQKQYAEGSEKRKKIDREVYRVKNELIKESAELERKEYDNSMSWIDDRKYYNEIGLRDELAAWQRVQKRYAEGTAERKKADREIYRLKNELRKADTDYDEKKFKIESDYVDKRKKLEEEYYAKTKEINAKLVQDIQNTTDQYNNAVKSRADALYGSYGLFDEITVGDPIDGTSLLKNLKDQVDAFDNWQKDITDLSHKGISEGLMKELTDMGPKSSAQIQALNQLSDVELTEYVALWQRKHAEAKEQATLELDGLKLETSQKIHELNNQAKVDLDTYKNTWSNQMQALKDENRVQLDVIKAEWLEKVGNIRTSTQDEFDAMASDVTSSVGGMRTQVTQEIVTLTDHIQTVVKVVDWKGLGASIILGMVNGIRDSGEELTRAVTDVMREALAAAEAALASTSASPTITPVVDMSNIDAASRTINGLGGSLNVGSATKKAQNVANDSVPGSWIGGGTNSEPQPTSIKIEQNNYSPKPLSRLDIYRDTKNLFTTLKGLVTGQ